VRVIEGVLRKLHGRHACPFSSVRLLNEFVRESTFRERHFAEELERVFGLRLELEHTVLVYLTAGYEKYFKGQLLKAWWDVGDMWKHTWCWGVAVPIFIAS
jgi:hypothetical protein